MMISKPMLSATVHRHEFEKLQWPLLVSPKLDGIRCLIHPTLGAVTRSFKPIQNGYIRDTLNRICRDTCLDGELIALDMDGSTLDFSDTQSAVMTRGGHPPFVYCVFDCFAHPDNPFETRFADTDVLACILNSDYVELVEHMIVKDEEELLGFAEESISQGYEGTMIRVPHGPYKSGRSTLNQGWLIKYKEWIDAEGTIIDFEERMHNSNPDIKDNFGYAKRSAAKGGMVPMGTLGALVLDTEWGELRVGSGFDDALRQSIWDHNMVERLGEPDDESERFVVRAIQRDIGRKVTFKYQPFGMQDKPRFPIFLHFREEE